MPQNFPGLQDWIKQQLLGAKNIGTTVFDTLVGTNQRSPNDYYTENLGPQHPKGTAQFNTLRKSDSMPPNSAEIVPVVGGIVYHGSP